MAHALQVTYACSVYFPWLLNQYGPATVFVLGDYHSVIKEGVLEVSTVRERNGYHKNRGQQWLGGSAFCQCHNAWHAHQYY